VTISRTGLAVGLLYLFTVVCFISHYNWPSEIFLWIGVIASTLAVWASIRATVGKGYKLVSVILFLICIRILPMLRLLLSGLTFRADAADALQLAQQIDERGSFDFGIGTGRAPAFSYFPAMYILTVVLANISGSAIETIAYLLPLLTGIVTMIVFYVMVRGLSDEVAALAIVVYSMGRTFLFFDDKYVPEAFGLTFYAISLMMFFYIYVYKKTSPKLAAIGTMAYIMVALSHHWSSFNLIFILTFFFCFVLLHNRLLGRLQRYNLKLRFSAISLLLSVCVLSTWLFFVANNVAQRDLKVFARFLSLSVGTIQHTHPIMPVNTPLERALIVAGYSVLAIVGVLKFSSSVLERDKASNEVFFRSWFIFGAVFILLPYTLASATFYYIDVHRTWSFAFFGLSPVIAWGLVNIPFLKPARRKKLATFTPLLLIFPLISTVLAGPVYVRNPFYYPEVESYRNTGFWIRYHLNVDTVVIDTYSREIVATYGRVPKAIPPVITDTATDQQIIVYESADLSFVAPAGSTIVLNNELNRLGLWFLEGGRPLKMANATVCLKDTGLRCQRIYDCSSLTVLKGYSG